MTPKFGTKRTRFTLRPVRLWARDYGSYVKPTLRFVCLRPVVETFTVMEGWVAYEWDQP